MIGMKHTTREDVLAHSGKDWNEIYCRIRALGEIAIFKEENFCSLTIVEKSTTLEGEPGKGDFGKRLMRC